jgi:hypothetical protein
VTLLCVFNHGPGWTDLADSTILFFLTNLNPFNNSLCQGEGILYPKGSGNEKQFSERLHKLSSRIKKRKLQNMIIQIKHKLKAECLLILLNCR